MNRREAIASLLMSGLALSEVRAAVRRLDRVERAAQTSDLTSLTIADASALLAKRDITPLQLVDAYLSRIDRLNKDLNAYVTVTRDLARREARNLDDERIGRADLYGIPIAHKDLFETKGVRTTAGSMLFENHIPDNNAALVQQIEATGALLLGKTNTHELGGGVTTINPFFGTTRNPVDRTRIAGGSSGGSAAAVAAHLCAAATGSDTGGSVRIPAAFCGCVGFKPTYGRISTQGLLGSVPTFDHVGFLTRTIEDAQLMFRVFGGTPVELPKQIRVGVARNFFFDALESPVSQAVDAAIASMKTRANVADIVFPISEKTMSTIFDPIVVFEIWGRFGADWRTNPGSFSKAFSSFFSIERPSVVEYESALAALKEYQAAVDTLFDSVDVIVTPTVATTAPPIAGPIDGMKILRNTWPFNAAGTPAISIPIARTGLPVGLQVVARRGEDDKLLQAARALGTHP
jgi:aspartyl-tRNA(Asn)/glutamyl-tRNA(Gln) amidotransferase subunit A